MSSIDHPSISEEIAPASQWINSKAAIVLKNVLYKARRVPKYIWLAGAAVLFFTVLIFSIYHRDAALTRLVSQVEGNRNVLLNQLGDIHTQLDKLASNGIDAATQPALVKISQELGDIEKNVTGVAKSAEVQKIIADMDARFGDLEKTVTAGNGSGKEYLDPKTLPFSMVSIDVISQQPFVSVDYDHRIIPLGVGDSLAGWKVTAANYDTVEAEFKNDQGQYVKVSTLGKTASSGDKA